MPKTSLKNGWKRVAFGDVVRQVRDVINPSESGLERYVAGEHMETDDLRIRNWGLIGDGYLGPAFHMRFKPGHVLYGSRRTYLRKVALAEFEGITANTTFVLEPKDPRLLLPSLLPFIMQTESFHEHSMKESKGSVNPYVNFSDLTWYEFLLPPLDQQRSIIDTLSAVSDYKYKLGAAMMQAAAVEEALFHSAVFRGSYEPERSNSTPVAAYSQWPLTSVSEVANVAYGISAAVSDNQDPSIGWPILTGANITLSGELDLKKLVYYPAPKKEEFVLRAGDVLLNWRSGSQAHVGKAALFQLEGKWTFASFILRARPSDSLNSFYLWRVLNYMRKNELFGTSTSQQVNFKMNAAYFRDVRIPCPPRNIQDRIVDQLQPLWSATALFGQRLVETKETVRSIIARLLGST